jgi:benzoyl-CoA reductase/2-hydroxyglutaryl-CoA dehydratase subunit BcrC/BadD/HgdB
VRRQGLQRGSKVWLKKGDSLPNYTPARVFIVHKDEVNFKAKMWEVMNKKNPKGLMLLTNLYS